MTTVEEQTPGSAAVLAWSKKIHGQGDRHAWALHCAALMDALGPDAHLPAFPSPFKSTQTSRVDAVRRVYRQAGGGRS